MIKAVIFDLDGTLVYLPINYDLLFEEFGRIAKTGEVRPLTLTISRLDEDKKKEIFEVWDKAEFEALAKMTSNKRGIAIYREFSEKPKALVTMQGRALVLTVLERLNLSFDFLATREVCLDRVEQLKIAAENLGSTLPNILFVGNTDSDLHAAKKAGCQFLRVTDESLV
ncbi:HAD-IA family hydrolase [Candidatus Bathyarchaeota archaeon]|nr:HAD-IA family hydrolase [Candidatus Bathyarchaeota archaeon]